MSVAPTAPTPPTKPTPPALPALAPTHANTAANPAAAAPASPSGAAGLAVTPEVTDAVRKLEGLGQAFQGKTTSNKAGNKVDAATGKATGTPNSMQAVSPTASSRENGAAAGQTAVSPNQPVPAKASSGSYLPFLGFMVIIIVVVAGLCLFKRRPRQRALADYSRQPPAMPAQDDVDVVVAPRTSAAKGKSNFEVRV